MPCPLPKTAHRHKQQHPDSACNTKATSSCAALGDSCAVSEAAARSNPAMPPLVLQRISLCPQIRLLRFCQLLDAPRKKSPDVLFVSYPSRH